MSKRILILITACVAALTTMQAKNWLGGDISMLSALQNKGAVYNDNKGKAIDPYKLFRKAGWNMMRVRLFVDPQNANAAHKGEGVCQDLPYVIDLCRTIKKEGFAIMLDFHYSDTWADPAKQYTPKRWEGLDAKTLADSIYRYTKYCLFALKKAGVAPDMIQVGNEITYGMDWPTGRVDPLSDDNWNVLGSLLKAGVKACREECPKAQLIIHTEHAGDWDMTESYYEHLDEEGVDYDIIGLSYYPMWHKSIPNLSANLSNLTARFPNKPIMIVETAYFFEHDGKPASEFEDFSHCPPGTVEGQREFTAQLVNELTKHKNVIGLFWWYPEETAFGVQPQPRGLLNRGLFDPTTGNALPALYEMKRFKKK